MTTEPVIPTFKGQAAIDLWLAGKEHWNGTLNKLYFVDISFEGVDFSVYRTEERPTISFAGFRFPRGNIVFSKANFGDGDVIFSEARFEGGQVLFDETTYGRGSVKFDQVIFETKLVRFRDSRFLSDVVDFSRSNFDSTCVDFTACTFSKADVIFYNARFTGYVQFSHTDFGSGFTDFHAVQFGDGNITFSAVSFGKSNTSFNETVFGNGDIYFDSASFASSEVSFFNSRFGTGLVRLHDLKCAGASIYFTSIRCQARFWMRNISQLDSLSFRDATFDNVLSISDVQVNNIVDLVNTKLTNQFSLHGLDCSLQREKCFWFFKKAVDPADVERANRLKDLAENNKHHTLGLKFHAIEMRAKRWKHKSKTTSYLLDWTFDWLCNYGQSVLQPFSFWLLLTTVFAVIYTAFFRYPMTTLQQAGHGFVFSIANSLPFLNTANEGRNKALEILFKKEDVASYILPLMMIQRVLSVLLLFLVGLGLRNRFRI